MLLLFQRGLIMHNLHITLSQQTLVSQQPRSSHPPNVLIIPTTAILYSKEKRQDSLPQLPDATGKCIITNMESLNAQKNIYHRDLQMMLQPAGGCYHLQESGMQQEH